MWAPVELLVIARAEQTVATLCSALEQQGIAIDVAGSTEQARDLFLDRGGHRLLVVGPDTGAGMAQQVAHALRSVDPQLPVVAFGQSFRDTRIKWLTRIPDFHPSSRAGIGAVLKVIQGLGPR